MIYAARQSRLLVALMREAIDRCRLDLKGHVVLTEAASGAYVVTPLLAAMAGADRVYALTRSTQYGSVSEVTDQTLGLAGTIGVQDRIQIITEKSQEVVSRADILTNSGHLRPIDAVTVSWMKPTAVIPLMYESWEFRPGDVDLAACAQRGVAVAGTNERHPDVDVFSFLGVMAIKLCLDAGLAVQHSRILLLCDNPFYPFLLRGLEGAGATVDAVSHPSSICGSVPYDVILVALTPDSDPVVGGINARVSADLIAARWPRATVVQFWGDIDRDALTAAGNPYWPVKPVAKGHMAILPSAVGPEPVVRLQCGGLKVAELLLAAHGEDRVEYAVASGYAQPLPSSGAESGHTLAVTRCDGSMSAISDRS